MNPHQLYRIIAPHFVCGVIVESGKVIRAAPIVKYMAGWTAQRVTSYAQSKGWTVTIVE